MELQNNNITPQSQEPSLSLGVKIILVIGGFIAAISAAALALMIGKEKGCIFFGIIYYTASLLLSYSKKSEIRFALVIPLFIASNGLISFGAPGSWFHFRTIYIVISLLALPAMFLTGDQIHRHLSIAQFCWFLPLGFLAKNSLEGYYLVAGIALVAYYITICSEQQISQNKYLAPELRTMRLVLLILAMGLLIWADFVRYNGHSDGIQSIAAALILLPLTFWAADRAGLALSILYLIYALTLFYYNMEVDLLHKSLLLMGCGAVMIASFFILKKLIK